MDRVFTPNGRHHAFAVEVSRAVNEIYGRYKDEFPVDEMLAMLCSYVGQRIAHGLPDDTEEVRQAAIRTATGSMVVGMTDEWDRQKTARPARVN